MNNLLANVLGLAVLVFAVTSMLSVGLGYSVREILGPLRHTPGVVRALIANFVLVPLLGLAVTRLLRLDQSHETGLILLSMAAGAPFLVKLTAHAGHDVGLSATLLVLLLPITAIYLPLAVPLVAPHANVKAGAIAMPLLLTMLLPLAIGLWVRERSAAWGKRLQPIMAKVSSIALLVLVVATFLANFHDILHLFGTGAILGALLVIGGAFLIGYALGGRDPEVRGVLGLATGQRNIAAATVVASQWFHNSGILVMVVACSLLGLALLFPVAKLLRQRRARHAEAYA